MIFTQLGQSSSFINIQSEVLIVIQKFSFNVFFFLFIFCFLYFSMQSPKRNPLEWVRILVFRPEYPGDWYQNLLFTPLNDSREIIPAPFITRVTSFERSFSNKFPQPKKVTWNESQSYCICFWHQLSIWHTR